MFLACGWRDSDTVFLVFSATPLFKFLSVVFPAVIGFAVDHCMFMFCKTNPILH